MRWGRFADAAPELASLVQVGIGEQNLGLLGTLRRDGWPRISPSEIYIAEGELLLGMMPGSRKVRDLERDPRLTVMTPQCDREPRRGDAKLYGRAIAVDDPGLRERYGQTIFAATGWRPDEPYPLFAVDIERATTSASASRGDSSAGPRRVAWRRSATPTTRAGDARAGRRTPVPRVRCNRGGRGRPHPGRTCQVATGVVVVRVFRPRCLAGDAVRAWNGASADAATARRARFAGAYHGDS